MKEVNRREENIDLKKFALLFQKKIKQILLCVCITALLFVAVYLLERLLFHSEKNYRVSSDYYITFNLDQYPNGVDYYNAYTWDSILRDDPIMDLVMENLPERYSKEQVKATISGEMLGDYRILSVYVTSSVPEQAEEIASALEQALERFPERMDMISKIEAWSKEPCQLLQPENKAGNAMALGAIVGLVLAGIGFAFQSLLDDSIYTEKDYHGSLPFLGMMTKKNSVFCREELSCNLKNVLNPEKKYCCTVLNGTSILPGEVYDSLREICPSIEGCYGMKEKDLAKLKETTGMILMVPWGKKNGRVLEKTVLFLEKQNCHPVGVIFYGAEDPFLQKYYGVSSWMEKGKEE